MNDIEIVLFNIWKGILGQGNFSKNNDFFEIGGNSIKAVQLASRISKEFSIQIQLTDIFLQTTITQLAALIKERQKENTSTPFNIKGVSPRPSQIPLSFGQERLWFIDQLEGSLQYHIPAVLHLKGNLNIEALANALQSIVNRHEVLRTIFLEEDGLAFQFINDTKSWGLQMINGSLYQPRSNDLIQVIQQLIVAPFNLSKDYMLRGSLITLSEQEFVLVVTMHHVASDGWSTAVLVKEVIELYNAYLENREPRLVPLPVQYADYAIWQRNYLHGEVLDKKINYWKNKLQDVAPLQLPTDYSRPAIRSNQGTSINFGIEKELTEKLQHVIQQQGTTLFMILLAVLKVLLHRYSGQQDICVGSPISNRTKHEVEGLIGFFVNTLALRSEVSSNASFTELLLQVRATTMEAYEHQDVPFEKVVEAVVKERDLSLSPLFQVMLVLQNNAAVPELRLGEVKLSIKEHEHTTTQFDITFNLTETSHGLQGSVEYATDLYNGKTILRMVDHFKMLLSSIVKNPHQKIGELQMLTAAEEQQLLIDFNNTKVDYPRDKTIIDLFEDQAAKTPGVIAVIFEEEQLTYQQLNERANQLAHYLRNRGVKEETLVPICIERSLDMITGILGILKAGGAYVPIDPEYPEERINYMLEDTAAAIVLTSKESISKLQAPAGVQILELDGDWLRLNGQLPTTNYQRITQPHHLAYVIYTSGSTGKPKGVMNEHRGLVNRLCWAQDYYGLTSEDSILQKTTFCFDVSVWELLWPLLVGSKLVFAKPEGHKDPHYLKSIIDRQKITMVHFVPSMLGAFLSEVQPGDCKGLKRVLCSGEALKQSQIQLFIEKLSDTELHNLYGPTEAAIDVTYWSMPNREEEIKIVPIGRPVANTSIYILDTRNRLVPMGGIGEINIGGVQVARGYLNRPELTTEKFIADPFSTEEGLMLYKTGDLGRWLADGNIEYLGRIDDQVKIRGYRIELGEIETVVQQSELVRQAVVLARADSNGNKRLVGYVVAGEAFNREQIVSYLKAKLPEYMVPAVWMELESLPLTANGKIDRKALPDPDASEMLSGQYVAPRNEVEEKMAAIWQELLGVEKVGVDDNFFELGGDSILTMQVASRVKRLGYEMHPKDLFIHQTIGNLSKQITQRSQAEALGEQGILSGSSGLLPIQQWYLENEQADIDHFNQSVLLGIDKAVTERELNQVVAELIDRHDALRFKYYKKNGRWQQEYGSAKGVISIEDLRSAEGTYTSLITEHANRQQQSLDIEKGELIKVVLMQMPEAETHNRLFIVIHHLAIDGVSWRILLDDMEMSLTELKNGRKIDLGHKSNSYRQWFEVLDNYSKTERLLSQRPYWQRTVKNYEALPIDKEYNGEVMVKDIALYSQRLGADHTRLLLQEVPRVYHTVINDLLLCAMAMTLCNWSEKNKITIGLEGHGRDDIGEGTDTNRTVGWFTSLYPVLLETEANAAGDWIKSVKEQLRKVPDMGLGYGVLKYLNKEKSLQGKEPWDVIFNYLGQFDNVVKQSVWLTGADESTGSGVSKEHIVNEKLTINCYVKAGELVLNWSYSTKHYQEETIRKIGGDYISNLEGLISHCMKQQVSGGVVYTPSDYGLGSDISYEELDRFLSEESSAGKRAKNISSIYRLSSLQQGMLFHGLYDDGSGLYIEQFSCDIIGLDVAILNKSWDYVLKGHSILRSAFYYNEFSVPVQCVYREVKLPVEYIDYRGINEVQQAEAIKEYEETDRHKGFDFKVAPLMRIALLRLSEDRYRMLWTSHHILFDGWSMPILMEEFLTTYELLAAGKEVRVKEEDRYEDYIRYIERGDKEQEEKYWRNYMKGVEQSTLLPFISTTKERNKGQGIYKSLSLQVNAVTTAQIEKYAQKHRITVNTVMQGIWAYLLHRYTGNTNVVYGVIVSGRPDDLPGVEHRVGMYINSLPLHATVPQEQQIGEWLQGIQGEQVSSRQYQHTALQDIQQWTGVQGDLFDTILVFENYPISKLLSSGKWSLQVENVRMHEQTNYPFNITISAAEQIHIEFVYNSGLLEEAYASKIQGHFEHVLLQIINDEKAKLGDIELLTSAEEQQLLVEFNDTAVDYPKDKTIVDLFEEQAAKTPGAIAVVFEEEQLSYQQLNEKANQLADYLRSRGVKEETLVPICIERGLEMIVGILGILKAGGAYVPIDPEYPQERISYMLEDTEASIVVTSKESRSKLQTLASVEIIELDSDWFAVNGQLSTVNYQLSTLNPHHLAYVIYTSGSTGKPKGVMIEHRSVVNLLKSIADKVDFTSSSGFLSVTTFSFDICYLEFYMPLISGGRLIVIPRAVAIDGFKLSEKIAYYHPTHMQATPSTWQLLLESEWENKEGIKILIGGEAVKEEIKQQLTNKGSVYNLYGPTETTIWSVTNKLEAFQKVLIGKPIANTSIKILDDHQNLVPIGVPGEICIGGDGLARGYLNRADLTAEKFINDSFSKRPGARIYRTGDLGRWLPDGNIECLGRIDDQVKIRGYRIELGEIEALLLQTGIVRQAVVSVKEDKQGNKRLVGYVVPVKNFDKESVVAYLKEKLPEYMVPALWVVLENLPLTPNGKVDRKALPDPDGSELSSNNYVAPRNEVEEKLAAIWQELLSIERVGIHDNFFELGGHSLLAMQVISAIRKQLDVELAIKDLFLHPTVADLWEHLQSQSKGLLVPSIEVQPKPEFIPLSFSQERLWFIDLLEGSVEYNLPAVLRLRGHLNKAALEHSLQMIADRHEVLRTIFLEREGKPYQLIKEKGDCRLAIIDGSSYRQDAATLQEYIQQLINTPFVLSKDHMIRAALLELSQEEYILVVTMHHIAADAWSMPLIIKEVAESYKAFVEDRPAQLAPLPIQYADYALWQRNYLQGEVFDKKINYWKEKLEGITPLQLPADFSRPAARSTRGASKDFSIDKKLFDQLHNLSRGQGATMYMTLLAAFKVLLYKYSGQQDITVGTSIANRSQRELGELIGFFVNTLALRSEVNGEGSFTEFLQQVKLTTLEAYEHQDVPFEKVVEVVVKERDAGRSPLFQVMLVLRNTPESSALRLGEVELFAEEIQSGVSKFDITFFISETANGLQGTVEYATDLYRESTIVRMLGHFKELLSSIVKNPQQKIGKLPMLTKAEEQQLLVEFNNTKIDYPKDKTIVDLFEEQAERTPQATAVVFENEQLSYQQLNEKANQLAHYLRSLGVKEETLVPLCMERGLDMMTAMLGILKAGAAYVPIDADFPADRISYMLEDTGASIVITSKESRSKLPASAGVEIIELDGDWLTVNSKQSTENYQLPTTNYQQTIQPHHAAYVIYTSGSTGQPKGVIIEHRHLVDYIFGLNNKVQINECKSFALVSTIATDLGNTVIYASLLSGGALHLFSKEATTNVEKLHEYFAKHKIDCLKIVPSHWKALCTEDELLLPAKLLVFGGEALPSEVAANIQAMGSSCRVVNHYGPTETTIGKLLHLIEPGKTYGATIPIGKPFSNTTVYVLSRDMELSPVGVPGQLFIAGDGVARGYFNKPEITKEKFIADPFIKQGLMYGTGDLVKYLADGNIEFIGRVDDQVKIRGYRIELGEIETVLNHCQEVRQAVVLAREDKHGNKRLVSYIVPEGYYEKEEIIAYLKDKLPEYMVPALLVEMEVLPLTANGKVDRKALPDPDAGELLKDQYIGPRNETEQKLAAIWQDVLEVEQVGVYDDFFELGGHSLLAVRLISAIRKEFAVEMPIGEVFDHPTIALLAAQLAKPSDTKVLPTIEVTKSRPERIPLSFSQERLWFIDQLEGSVQYHVPAVLRLKGSLNREALAHSLETIVDRHEVLRTVFLQEEGKAYQEIKPAGKWDLISVDGVDYAHDNDSLQKYLKQIISEPFDLTRDYMLRAHLINLGEEEHILTITLHHIASDGWSRSILVKEVVELYEAYTKNREPKLTPLPVQYADYALWQRKHVQGDVLNEKLDYWKNKLQDVAPLQLPTDYVRPAVLSNRGASKDFFIDKKLSTQLQLLSQQKGTTLFMTLLAAFKVLLHRYSGQQDICVGSPIAGRPQSEVEQLIGFFINTLALRTEVNSDALFTKLLQKVRETTMEAYDHQDIPFEKVVEAVVKERDLSRSPLTQVQFVLDNAPEIEDIQLGNLLLSQQEYEHTVSKLDITFFIKDTVTGLQGSVEYATDLYTESTITRMLIHFEELLSSIVQSPQQKIGELQMITKSEEQQLLVEFNDTKADYPKDKTIVDLFEEQAAKTPQSIAVVFEEEQLSYQQLNERANQLAHYLRSKEVKEETLVPVCIERSLEMIVGILGILKAGGAYVPIDPEYPAERISYMLEDTAASIIISSKASRSKLQASENIEIIELDNDWSTGVGQLSTFNCQPSTLKPHHLAYVIYTSGSTGKPKGVMNQHSGVVNRLCWAQDYYKLTDKDSVLQKTTFSFDVSVWELLWPLLAGAKLVFAKPGGHKDNDYLKSIIEEREISMLHFVPSMLGAFLPDLEPGDCKSLRKVLCSGEALKHSHVELFKEKLPDAELHNLYGPTEAAIDVTYWSLPEKEKEIKTVPIGRPVANTRMYIFDKQQNLVPVGVSGEIHIGGVQVARGYLNRPELTAEKFIADKFNKEEGARLYKTGDLGKWLKDGNIDYLGRIDEQVKIRGHRIELGEIETVLQQSGLVNEMIVLAKEDKTGNKKLVGYAVPAEKFDKEIIITYLKDKLPEYMVPAMWVELHSLPLTSNGKIDRKALPDPDLSELLASEYIEPRNEIEENLVAIWQGLLGINKVSITDNFFELGGDSILTIQVSSQLKRLGYQMHPRDIFIHQTIEKLSKAIIQRLHEEVLGEQGLLTGLSGLLPIQQWYLENEQPDIDHFNQSVLLGIDKSVTESDLNKIVEELVNHHDALRFKYYKKDGEWQQEYGSARGVIIKKDLRSATNGTPGSLITGYANTQQQSLDINKGELIKAALIQMPESETHNRILIVIHHMAVDGVSWRILLEDIAILLNELKNKRKPGLGKKNSSYRQWFNVLEDYGKKERLFSQKSYWQQAIKSYEALPVDIEDVNKVKIKDLALQSQNLGAEHTKLLLHEVPKVYHTTINDMLLCAMAITLCKWSGKDKINIGLEGHGREDIANGIDTIRTVGWFTSLYPVLIEKENNSSAGHWIKSVKEQLRKIPDNGIGYGVLKYLNKEESMQEKDPWDMIFNYLGQFDNVMRETEWLTPAQESTGFGRSKEHIINEKFTVNCHIKSGELVVNWNYSTKHYHNETVKNLVADFISNLVELIDHCITQQASGAVYTPSDYGLGSDITNEELDRFLQEKEDNVDNIMSF